MYCEHLSGHLFPANNAGFPLNIEVGSFITPFLLGVSEFRGLPPLSQKGAALKAFPPGCLNYLSCRNQTFSLLSSCGF